MKILLINPPFTAYGGMEGHGGKAAPINLAYLASYILENRPKDRVSILDAEVLNLSFEKISQYIKQNSADLIGITTSTPSYTFALTIAQLAKDINNNVKVVLGGIHVSAFPKECCREKAIDVVVVGEGEETFLELLNSYENGLPFHKIKGICFKDNDEITLNESRPLIENLNRLPFPARNLLPNNLYHLAPTKRVSLYKSTLLTTARGCPYNCTFCSAKVVWQRKYRARSAENVIGEIEQCVRQFGIREFSITDELFIMDKKRVTQFCDGIIKKRLKIAWVCMSRVGYVSKDILRMMKLAGCREISFGIESGDEGVLKKMNKEITLSAAENSIRLVKRTGIKTHASYMIGNLGETEDTIRRTIDFAKRLNTDIAAFFIASPLPGTRFYEEAFSLGYIRKDADWKDYSPLSKSKPVINLPNLGSEELMGWQRRAIQEYYTRPRYILRRILTLRSKVDLINLYDGLCLFFRIKHSG